MPHDDSNHILLDRKNRIELDNLEDRYDAASDIDELLEPMKEFWMRLQTECKAECCGIKAFGFLPKQIKQASKSMGNPLMDQLTELYGFVLTHDSDTFVSSLLNQYFDRAQLAQLIEHITENLNPDGFVDGANDAKRIAGAVKLERMAEQKGLSKSQEFRPQNSDRRKRKLLATATTILTFAAAGVMVFWPQWYLYLIIGLSAWVIFMMWFALRD